ncbi:amino acid-binding protein [Desulfurispirillum indicum]|uniref:Amino acid-binding ACT domain protein n=1 Tax=Desulfurispirillum indicum (strain ATCC BAA-1389 / DSM 22839 / S5) TaxID=653733 RepID=E6W5L9_DESIS|nr:amino acid-binding protein [Desulfurispirillum indicum]ADU66050.1 amino acid-binding ACT domain protein [Desulfurispirillum indicum S5]UCZ55458.1 amino acid-binding protein [Desulfurispirillum indicum]
MKVQQISIFIENQAGRLAEVTRCLAEGNINIRALSLADTQDFGILRLIVNDVQAARKLLEEKSFTVGITDVVAIKVPDKPGGMAAILAILDNCNINVEYMYAYVDRDFQDNAVIIFRFENLDDAIACLTAQGVDIVKGSELYGM